MDVTENIRENISRWFGHVKKINNNEVVKKIREK